jgi:putative DNA primase/helicase
VTRKGPPKRAHRRHLPLDQRNDRDLFEFNPTHKLWIVCNDLPVVSGSDFGIWRRILVVPFTVTIPEDERDLGLNERLLTEREGILAWLVRGCVEWREKGPRSTGQR